MIVDDQMEDTYDTALSEQSSISKTAPTKANAGRSGNNEEENVSEVVETEDKPLDTELPTIILTKAKKISILEQKKNHF